MNEHTIVVGSPPATLQGDVAAMAALASSYVVNCPEAREAIGLDLQRNKSLQKTVEGERVKITKPINDGLRAVNELFKKLSGPLEAAEAMMKSAALGWDNEQRRIKHEAEAEAARKADEERKRLAAIEARERAAGNAEAAQVIKEAAEMVAPVPVVMPPPVKVAGEATRELWHAVVDDLDALCLAVGTGKVSRENVLPNMPTLNSQARSLKGTLSIPGVRAVCEQVLATRAA